MLITGLFVGLVSETCLFCILKCTSDYEGPQKINVDINKSFTYLKVMFFKNSFLFFAKSMHMVDILSHFLEFLKLNPKMQMILENSSNWSKLHKVLLVTSTIFLWMLSEVNYTKFYISYKHSFHFHFPVKGNWCENVLTLDFDLDV